MPRLKLLTALLSLVLTPALAARQLAAQQPGQPVAAAGTGQQRALPDSAVIVAFVKTHMAVDSLRDRYQAQYAEVRNKKGEVQSKLHDELLEAVQGVLKAHGFSDAEFQRLTRLVSADSAVRRMFEEAVARETKRGASG